MDGGDRKISGFWLFQKALASAVLTAVAMAAALYFCVIQQCIYTKGAAF